MTLTVTAVPVFPSGAPPAVQLSVSSSGIPANSALTVTRIHADGSEHRVITTDPPVLVPSTWVGLDYHAPYCVAVTYRVEAESETATASTALLTDSIWLVSPSNPGVSVRVDKVKEITDRSRDTRSAKYEPYGGKPVFHSEGVRSGAGTLTVKVFDEGPIMALLDQDTTILVNIPVACRMPWAWVQPKQVTVDDPWSGGAGQFVWVRIPYDESADPDVDQNPIWSCDVADAVFASEGVDCDTLTDLYATCDDLTINRRV